jgi:hypothetical protein
VRNSRKKNPRRRTHKVVACFVAIAMIAMLYSAPARAADFNDSDPQPVLTGDGTWAGAVVIIAIGLFLAAACIGPIVRMHLPEEDGGKSRDDRGG